MSAQDELFSYTLGFQNSFDAILSKKIGNCHFITVAKK